MDEYPFTTDVTVRYADTDAVGHVNNAVYATYLEMARTAYYAEAIGDFEPDIETVLARLEIDYLREIRFEDAVTVGVAITGVGRSSFRMAYEIRANDAVAARAETVNVTIDPETGKSRPLPERWREIIEAHRADGSDR